MASQSQKAKKDNYTEEKYKLNHLYFIQHNTI
jgi:hypothetical protein